VRQVAGFGRSPGSCIAAAALAFLSTAGCTNRSSTPAPTTTPAGIEESATVARVSDGDTLRTTTGRRVRLVQIDAPELDDDCYGKAALAALQKLTPPGARITLVRDPALDSTDRYGRQLRYVLLGGTNVNIALVRQGAASPYFFGGEQGRYAGELLDAVREARGALRGYWGACPDARLEVTRGSVTGPR